MTSQAGTPTEDIAAGQTARPQAHWLAAAACLLLTAAVVLFESSQRLLNSDEMLVLWTDNLSSLGALLQVQLHTPISLDPMVYHALAHLSLRSLGAMHAEVFALRLPSLLGFLLMQVCLYRFMRKFAGEAAALFAMAFPAATATLFYAMQARPYGLLLGLFALVMVSWQSAVRGSGNRWVALVTLAVALALALNTHYFALLLLAPLWLAELYRTLLRRRVDLPVVAAMVAGTAGMVFVLPFTRAAAVYQKHYYNSSSVNLHDITQAYRSLFLDYTTFPMSLQRLLAMLFVAVAALVIWAFVRQMRRGTLPVLREEIVFLVTLAALPFIGYAAARVLHSYEVRYVLGAMVAIAPLLAIALTPLLRGRRAAVVLAMLAALIAVVGAARIRLDRKASQAELASLVLSPAQKSAMMATPTQKLYMQDFGRFAVAWYYQPDPQVRARTMLLYSSAEEIHWCRRDTNSLTAMYLPLFTTVQSVPWEQVTAQPGQHFMVLYPNDGWNWTGDALAAVHARTTPLGSLMQGEATLVEFAP